MSSNSTQLAIFLSDTATIRTITGQHHVINASDGALYLSIYVNDGNRDQIIALGKALLEVAAAQARAAATTLAAEAAAAADTATALETTTTTA